jgi:hypothetical protein
MMKTLLRWLRRTRVGGPIEYVAQFLDGLLRPALLRSGAMPLEQRRPLPGDDLIAQPMWEATRAVTINTPVAGVWPWVAQLGYGRGGWYGWNPLEREDTGVSRLLPGCQALQVGDVLLDGPGCDRTKGAWTVKAVEPPRTLVLYTMRDPLTGRELDPATKPGRFIDCGWAFLLDPVGPRTTRLLARTRVRFGPRWLTLPVTVLLVKAIGGGDTVMQRRLLEGIKVRAEAAAAARRPGVHGTPPSQTRPKRRAVTRSSSGGASPAPSPRAARRSTRRRPGPAGARSRVNRDARPATRRLIGR